MSVFPASPMANLSRPQQARKVESALSVASGALMILPIIGKRSPWRWTAAITGGALIYHGVDRLRDGSHRARSTVEHLSQTITIGKSAAELFALWRNPDVLARVMQPFGEVTIIGTGHLRWELSTPFGSFDSEAVLVDEQADELVHWQTLPGSDLRVDEYMHFRPAPQGRGTEATLTYDIDFSRVPAGPVFRSITSFLERAPRSAIRKILHNFKSLAETGETATLERNPSGRATKNNGRGDLL